MSVLSLSNGTPKPADLFADLWRQLGECHQNALQELEAKVGKLKKERCLDAQRLEVFHNRNQQLREENKNLQNAISLLEERRCAEKCDQCAVLGVNLKRNKAKYLDIITTLKSERKILQDKNRELHSEVQSLRMSRSELQEVSEEDGIIPDSPTLPNSLPVANRLKKRRNTAKVKHVWYSEMPQSARSLFNKLNKEPADAVKNDGRAEVLVPNTCELEVSQTTGNMNPFVEEEIAETCGLELLGRPHMVSFYQETETSAAQQSSLRKRDGRLTLHLSHGPSMLVSSPNQTTDRSPSLLPGVRCLSDSAVHKAKRKKEGCEGEEQEKDKRGIRDRVGKRVEPEVAKPTSTPAGDQSLKEPLDMEAPLELNVTSDQRPSVSCMSPTFKKPNVRGGTNKDGVERRENRLQDVTRKNGSHNQHEREVAEKIHKVESMWSIDPAVLLPMHASEESEQKEEQQFAGELDDSDRTWISHSVLQRCGEKGRHREESELGEKANDSLNMMFDTTAYGEYKSCNSSHLDQSRHSDDEDDGGGEEEHNERDPCDNTRGRLKESKAQRPAFAHMAVVRKKDERRKLMGTTCKECEIYYTHLPEEEKQKKLSACSRHRFLYIPPCTPENFWEVGFPSTQTCIERGYIKEEKTPQARTRRKQPFNALFSPKQKQLEI